MRSLTIQDGTAEELDIDELLSLSPFALYGPAPLRPFGHGGSSDLQVGLWRFLP
jgi:hypothetical protein